MAGYNALFNCRASSASWIALSARPSLSEHISDIAADKENIYK